MDLSAVVKGGEIDVQVENGRLPEARHIMLHLSITSHPCSQPDSMSNCIWLEDLATAASREAAGEKLHQMQASAKRCIEEGGTAALYELSTVIIHSGSPGGGHYYAFIKDLERRGSRSKLPTPAFCNAAAADAVKREVETASTKQFQPFWDIARAFQRLQTAASTEPTAVALDDLHAVRACQPFDGSCSDVTCVSCHVMFT